MSNIRLEIWTAWNIKIEEGMFTLPQQRVQHNFAGLGKNCLKAAILAVYFLKP